MDGLWTATSFRVSAKDSFCNCKEMVWNTTGCSWTKCPKVQGANPKAYYTNFLNLYWVVGHLMRTGMEREFIRIQNSLKSVLWGARDHQCKTSCLRRKLKFMASGSLDDLKWKIIFVNGLIWNASGQIGLETTLKLQVQFFVKWAQFFYTRLFIEQFCGIFLMVRS